MAVPVNEDSALERTGAWSSNAHALESTRAALRPEHLFDSAIVFWRGTSGHEYVHTIYALVGCPEVPPGSVMLVRKNDCGRRLVLAVMCVDSDEPSLNLAEIRQAGARLGANEVHLHFAIGNRFARHTAAMDLRTQHGPLEVVGD